MIWSSRLALPVFLLLAGAAIPAAAQSPGGGEIFKSWIGKTLDAETAKGAKIALVFAADGAASISGAFSDSGKWRLADDGYCTTWKKSRSGREECYSVVPDGKIFLIRLKSTGELSGKVTPP